MSRFVLGNCIDVMTRIPDNAIDFILTDPPYLVGFRDRSGRTIAGDKTDEWLQPACNEMYRVLKKDALMVSFYGWNRVDRFMAAWKNAGFSVVGHLVFTKNYTSKAAYVGYRHECAYILAKGRPRLPQNPLPDVLGWKYSGNRHHPTEKPVTSLQPLIESFTHPNAIVLDPFAGSGSTCVAALQSGRRYIGIELLEQYHRAGQQRLTGYSGKRASESAQALDEVERLAAMIPPGQPILVGHHSERRARRDAQRIENGMKRAVMLFERAEYWEERARSALLHAKYKERPDVRWRRIKKIEADLRKAEKTIAQSQKYLTMWRAESLDLNMAKLISSHDHISACFPLDTYPRPAEKSQYEGSRSLWSALDDDIITTEQAREIAIRCHERQIQHQQRWVNHYQNRLIYERAMLDESGGVVTRTQDFEPGGQVFSRGEWLTIIRVNKSNGAVSSVTTPNYSFLGYSGTMKVTPDRITDYKAPSAEEAAVASQAAKRPPVVNYPGEGFREMTKAQWAALPRDCKAVRSVAEAEDHGAYRYRRTMDNNFRLVNVYITDMKITEIPQK